MRYSDTIHYPHLALTIQCLDTKHNNYYFLQKYKYYEILHAYTKQPLLSTLNANTKRGQFILKLNENLKWQNYGITLWQQPRDNTYTYWYLRLQVWPAGWHRLLPAADPGSPAAAVMHFAPSDWVEPAVAKSAPAQYWLVPMYGIIIGLLVV